MNILDYLFVCYNPSLRNSTPVENINESVNSLKVQNQGRIVHPGVIHKYKRGNIVSVLHMHVKMTCMYQHNAYKAHSPFQIK